MIKSDLYKFSLTRFKQSLDKLRIRQLIKVEKRNALQYYTYKIAIMVIELNSYP